MSWLPKTGLLLLWQAVLAAVSVVIGLGAVAHVAVLASILSGSEFSWGSYRSLMSGVTTIMWIVLTIDTAPMLFEYFNNKKGE